MDNYKTIKELADELNVSKQTIQYHYQRLDKSLVSKNVNGVNQVSSQAEKIIVSKVNKKNRMFASKECNSIDKEAANADKDIESIKSLFKSELDSINNNFELLLTDKDQQIDIKNQQIEKLQKLLDQQQQLTLQSNKQIEKLQNQFTLLAPKMENEEEDGANEEPIAEEMSPIKEQPKKETPFKFDSIGPRKKWWQLWK